MTRLLPLLLIPALLTGCGAGPVGAADPGSTGTRSVISLPTTDYGEFARNQLGGTGVDEGRGAELLRQARVALAKTTGFQAEVSTRTFGPFVNGADTGTSREAQVRYELAFARPARFKAAVLESAEPDLGKIAYATEDGKAFRVRTPGLIAGLLTRAATASDGRFRDARDHGIQELRPDVQLARLTSNAAIWTVLGEGRSPDGRPSVRILVERAPRLDAEITREEVELTTEGFAFVRIASYVGARRVVAFDFARFTWGAPPADAFQI